MPVHSQHFSRSKLNLHREYAGESSQNIAINKGHIENCDGLPRYSHPPVTTCE